jgi:hypothetical protein
MLALESNLVDDLKNELKACYFWDCCFLCAPKHDLIDTIAFVNRQKRREELILAIAAEENKAVFGVQED